MNLDLITQLIAVVPFVINMVMIRAAQLSLGMPALLMVPVFVLHACIAWLCSLHIVAALIYASIVLLGIPEYYRTYIDHHR